MSWPSETAYLPSQELKKRGLSRIRGLVCVGCSLQGFSRKMELQQGSASVQAKTEWKRERENPGIKVFAVLEKAAASVLGFLEPVLDVVLTHMFRKINCMVILFMPQIAREMTVVQNLLQRSVKTS